MACGWLYCPVLGFRSYVCIDAVRFCLGVGKYTPNDAVPVNGKTTTVRQWKSVYLYWSKLRYMTNDRLNKLIAL